ncbi:cysteine proteinase [Lichtheimia hyalospora FSU 10163]|nr:cysteine proteinase [Lichtheimia hyalospora FSU 10163]
MNNNKVWIPLESNPQVLNEMLCKLNIDKKYEFIDIYDLNINNLKKLKKEFLSFILLIPDTKKYRYHILDEDLNIKNNYVDPKIYFMKQTIRHACGTIALIHSLTNNKKIIKDGIFKKFLNETEYLSYDMRGKYLENCKEIEEIHYNIAKKGQSKIPGIEDEVNFRYISFIKSNNYIYELEGSRMFPINRGLTDDFLYDIIEITKKFIKREMNNLNFSLISLTCSTDI